MEAKHRYNQGSMQMTTLWRLYYDDFEIDLKRFSRLSMSDSMPAFGLLLHMDAWRFQAMMNT